MIFAAPVIFTYYYKDRFKNDDTLCNKDLLSTEEQAIKDAHEQCEALEQYPKS